MRTCILIQELSKDSRDAVRGFLTKVGGPLSLIIEPFQDPEQRLGAEGTNSVKEHCFFYGIDWLAVQQVKKIVKPKLVKPLIRAPSLLHLFQS